VGDLAALTAMACGKKNLPAKMSEKRKAGKETDTKDPAVLKM
jgi:hypothetical protein